MGQEFPSKVIEICIIKIHDNMRSNTREVYAKNINIVTDYVDTHLGEKIELSKMSELANLSVYHFHRIARAILKQPFGEYVTRLRIESAARMLRYTDKTISEIAYSVGFETPSGLSKRFKKYYGITPKEYRLNLELFIISPFKPNNKNMINPKEVILLEDQSVAYIRLTGNFAELDYEGARNELMGFAFENELINETTRSIGVCFDDPHITKENNCRYDVAITVDKDFTPIGKVGKKMLKGGKYVVFKHKGPYEKLDDTYDAIYGKWLFESGVELSDEPTFDLYVSDPMTTAPADLETHIYVPIKN